MCAVTVIYTKPNNRLKRTTANQVQLKC